MPVSQGSAGGIPGLNLKAWAYVKADGTLIRGLNVASFTRTGVGAYTVTFTAAMSSTDYVMRMTSQKGAMMLASMGAPATGSCTLKTFDASPVAAADYGGLWEFYE